MALGQRERITIYGDDYPTADGTCVRDYIHIDDLGDAHLKALDLLQPGQGLCVNLGTGTGTSVREIVEACREVTGHPIPEVIGQRRAGDPPELVADATLAKSCWAGSRDTGTSSRSSRPPGAGISPIPTVMRPSERAGDESFAISGAKPRDGYFILGIRVYSPEVPARAPVIECH